MELYLLNYADDRFGHKGGRFLKNQARLNESARKQGVENIVSWTWPKLAETPFYAQNKEYLDKNRFENGAVWKPFIVQQLLQEVQPGDIVFYYDCGAYTIDRPVKILTDLCIRNGGTLFHEWGEKNFKYTKRDAFVYMDCDTPKYHNAIALQNTWFLLQKNDFTVNFVNEWLRFNLDERIASYVKPNTCGLPDITGFVENRGDQSIFTNLAIKYDVRTFRGAGGIRNRQVNNFIDALSWRSRTQKLISTTQAQTKSWLKTNAYQLRSRGGSLEFTIKDNTFHLHPHGGAVRQLWCGDTEKSVLIEALLSIVESDSTVVEVGANVGVTTVPLAQKLTEGRLCAVEADTQLCQHLKDNLELNECLDQVTVVPAAIASSDSEVTLQVNERWRDPFNTIGKPIDENCRIVTSRQIPATTLPEILTTCGFSDLDLIVVDASGAELPIFQGAIALLSDDAAPLVVYNCLHRPCLGFGYQPQKTQELLAQYGYRLFKLVSGPKLIELSTDNNHQGFILGAKTQNFHKLKNITCTYLAN